MRRTIKFRGLASASPEPLWVYGAYCEISGKTYITASNGTRIEVRPDSVCQYTGQRDSAGKDVYEGDILDYEIYHALSNRMLRHRGRVSYNPELLTFAVWRRFSPVTLAAVAECNRYVAGNVYENRSLLPEEEEG